MCRTGIVPFSDVLTECPFVETTAAILSNSDTSRGNVLVQYGLEYILAPGESTPWFYVKNLNEIKHMDDVGTILYYTVVEMD